MVLLVLGQGPLSVAAAAEAEASSCCNRYDFEGSAGQVMIQPKPLRGRAANIAAAEVSAGSCCGRHLPGSPAATDVVNAQLGLCRGYSEISGLVTAAELFLYRPHGICHK